MSVNYPIRAVAKLTGLTKDTLRAWERRYGAVLPKRKGQARTYTEEDVQRLLRLRRALDRGHAIGQVAGLSDEELDELVARPAMAAEGPRRKQSDGKLHGQAQAVLDAIERFEGVEVELEMFRLASLMPTGELVHELVLPLMREVGERWHRGEFTVAQEHLASSVTRNLLGTLIRTTKVEPDAKRILIAAPAGELHEFGILAAALLAVAHRLQVTYLGVDLPGREVIDAASRSGAAVVLLGISSPAPKKGVTDEVHLIARGLASDIPLWIGGARPKALLEGVQREQLEVLEEFGELEQRLRELS